MAKKVTNKKKKSKSMTVLIVLLVILAALIALAAFVLTYSKPEPDREIDFDVNVEDTDEADETAAPDAPTVDGDKVKETIESMEQVEITKDEGWKHYLLLGVDGESNSYSGKRSDAMIVMSMNKEEERVVLSSIPRDTLVYIDGKGFDKLTHAYAYGGADLTVATYEDNFDIDIEGYVTVNFSAMRDIVDLLGGLTLTLTDAEAKHMGEYYAAWGLSGGTQLLNGKEVLAYCRVRKIDSDFKRTERQYKVLMQIYEEVKDLPLSKYTELITTVYPYVYTDLTVADAISLAGTLLEVTDDGEIEHVGLVDRDYCKVGNLSGKSVVLVDNLVDTAVRWRNALGIEEYTPSKRLVQISEQLDSTLGR